MGATQPGVRPGPGSGGTGVFRLDPGRDVLACSAGLRRLAPVPDAAAGGRAALRALAHPADRERLARALAEAGRGDEPVALPLRLGPEGTPARVVLLAERDAEGGLRAVCGTVEVGGEPEPRLVEARDRERALRDALDHVPHQVFVKDEDGRVLLANAAAAAVYGLSPAEIEGRLHAELHPVPDEVARMLADDREVIASGRAKQLHEEAFRDLAGRDRVLDTVKIPFRRGGRELVLGVAVDVTERRRAVDTGAQLALALRQAVEGIALVDRHGIITFANPALARMLDTPEEALVGAPFSATSSGSPDDEALLREIGRKVAAGEPWAGRYESRWRDGSRHRRDASVTPFRDADGRFRGIVAVLRDVTREVELEEELHQAQKMEAVGRLAGGIAHDFNNELTVIASCAEELEQALRERTPERDAAREITRAAQRSAEVIGQLLAFSRRTPLAPEVLDPNAVVGALASMLERLLPPAVAMRLVLDPAAASVRTDRGQLERAVVNLVLNARDAMPEGGLLTLETRSLPGGGGDRLRLTVRDDGVGMEREIRSRAFEPFFTTKGPGRGSGLGLPAVLGFVRQSGGSVEVESEPARGTAVHLHLPATAPAPAGAPAPAAADAHRDARILVVEDEDAVRALIERTLLRAGHRVRSAGDGHAALESLEREGPVDLVLADVRMPRMGGLELRAALAAKNPGTSVLLMSGFPGAERDEEDPVVLAKPFSPSALLRAVRNALAGRVGEAGAAAGR